MNYFTLALRNLKHRKLRASLTTIGIVIGIAAIIGLISISQGFQRALETQFEEIGANNIFIYPEGGLQAAFSGGMTDDDMDVLEGMSEFEWVVGYGFTVTTGEFSDQEVAIPQIVGFKSENLDKTFDGVGYEVVEGRFIKDGERGKIFVGNRFAEDLFDKKVRVGNKVLIKGQRFQVVGILERFGNQQDDNGVYMNIDDYREIFDSEDLNFLQMKVKEGFDLNEVAAKVERKLEDQRGNDNFDVQTPDQLMGQFNAILDIMQLVLVAIAAISLLVGGIGIMNSMYTSVLERTREIGIMKSLGAKKSEILKLFLFEAGALGLAGGLLGCIFGGLIAYSVQFGAEQAGFLLLKIQFEPWLYLSGLLFAFIVGMVSGALPAKQATDLQPVEALRYGT